MKDMEERRDKTMQNKFTNSGGVSENRGAVEEVALPGDSSMNK